MEIDPITCEYQFTEQEYIRTKILGRRLAPAYLKILFMILAFGLLGLGLKDFYWGLREGNYDFATYFSVVPGLALGIFLACRILPHRFFCSSRDFRKSHLFNRPMSVTLSEEGYKVVDDDGTSTMKWQSVTHAVESKEGFALYFPGDGKHFIWVPKHALLRQREVERSRELIRQRVRNFRLVPY